MVKTKIVPKMLSLQSEIIPTIMYTIGVQVYL